MYRSEIMRGNPDAPAPNSFTIQAPEFVGGVPAVVDSTTGAPFDTAGDNGAFHALERLVDHSENIKTVLAECIAFEEKSSKARRDSIKRRSKGKRLNVAIPPRNLSRTLTRMQCVLAEECFHSEDFPAALKLFQSVLSV